MNNVNKLPKLGELVIGTVKKINRLGAYITLDEYDNLEAFLHISEISLKWVKDIHEHLRENQREVFKVIRVNPSRLEVDVSLRRVSKRERLDKLISWKKKQKVLKIFSIIKEKENLNDEWINENIIYPLNLSFEELYDLFEEISIQEKLPEKIEKIIPERLHKIFIQICKNEIKPKKHIVKGYLILKSKNKYGVEDIREAIKAAISIKHDKASINVKIIAAPKYMILVEALNREIAEELIKKAAEVSIQEITKRGGYGEFKLM
jgi:translation initiation factor 2 subunit 1